MSHDLLDHSAAWSCLRGALAEIEASHNDCEKFFAEVFEEFEAMSAHLCAQANELTHSASQGRQQSEAAKNAEDALHQQLQQMNQRQALLEQERAGLASQLETVRNRAAELSESLAEQKRLASEQPLFWNEELKRMCSLLEGMSQRLNEAMPAAAAPQAVPRKTATDDPVLDSVMAQFEILQRDLNRRRSNS